MLSLATPIAGDVAKPGLGLSAEDTKKLQREVDTIIHCAADIRLEIPIQDTLRSNYQGTKEALQFALGTQNLRSFIHVSTAYTNFNQPEGATIAEKIYPLHYGDQRVRYKELVEVSVYVFCKSRPDEIEFAAVGQSC
jgi:fatty acyl-CoA reductase